MKYNGIVLCGHTGSHNRGCEAIIKSTADIFSEIGLSSILATHDKAYDTKVGTKEFERVIEYAEFKNKPIQRSFSLFLDRIFRLQYIANLIRQHSVMKTLADRLALNVGGDTYCYSIRPKVSINMNKYCFKNSIPCCLWACSIENDVLHDPVLFNDINRYVYIMPREPLSYNNLVNAGIDRSKLVKMADPAFTLIPKKCDLPKGFIDFNTVGINLSPLVMDWSNKKDLVWNNYITIIDYILNQTNMNICLIPHVYHEDDYDMIPHQKLYEQYYSSGRICIVKDTSLGCKQLKYIISRCRFMITARTHASIAAYSSLVPTLVMGYSIKSKGISLDLFGTHENYVVSTDDLNSNYDLLEAFKYIQDNENTIKKILDHQIPIMQKQARDAAKFILNNLAQ